MNNREHSLSPPKLAQSKSERNSNDHLSTQPLTSTQRMLIRTQALYSANTTNHSSNENNQHAENENNINTSSVDTLPPDTNEIITTQPLTTLRNTQESNNQNNKSQTLEDDFSKLTLKEELGHGTFGTVFKAISQGNEYAVKVVSYQTEHQQKLFDQEINILKKLAKNKVPHVVQFFGVQQHDETSMRIIMELMSNGSLEDVINSDYYNDFTTAEKVKWAADIAAAIYYLHKLGIRHNDIKSLNVLMDINYNAKLADFGGSNETGFFVKKNPLKSPGTVAWQAPEVLLKDKYSNASDVYSFGILMWEIFAGDSLPFFERYELLFRNYQADTQNIKQKMDEAKNANTVVDEKNIQSTLRKLEQTKKETKTLFNRHKKAMITNSVVKGTRPSIPQDCPPKIVQWMNLAWHQDPKKRPTAKKLHKALQDKNILESSIENSNSQFRKK